MSPFLRFFKTEVAGGVVLMLATLLALLVANSTAREGYEALLAFPIGIHAGDADFITKPLILWINDGLMAIFFLLIGLEIKREVMEGELSSRERAILPLIGALGGVVAPALIYVYFNAGTPHAGGWAIPCATDIAFSLGVLALFGSRVPTPLKVFLMAIAVADDLLAVVIIAVFFTAEIQVNMLLLSVLVAGMLAICNLQNVQRGRVYLFLGVILWFCVLKSGVHATIAGVLLGLLIPLRSRVEGVKPFGRRLIHSLHPWVAFGIVPVFAFANAGLPLAGLELSDLLSPLPLGITLGLFIGKQIGIFTAVWMAVRLGVAKLPQNVRWPEVYAVSIIAGIGFTMSLFIGGLSFSDAGVATLVRLGVISGSLCSALVGCILLAIILRRRDAARAIHG